MAHPTLKSIRDELNFEQQARFDALFDSRQKRLGTATVLSLPLLGTFGVEEFYLGNVVAGIVRLLFSFTLIPTISALFDILTGDLRRQVDFANLRVARKVAMEVIATTPKEEAMPQSPVALAAAEELATQLATPPPPAAALASEAAVTATEAAMATIATAPAAEPIAEAASTPAAEVVSPPLSATETPLPVYVFPDPTLAPPAAPSTVEVATAETAQHVAAAEATFTATTTTSDWHAGLGAPKIASESATATFASSALTEVATATTAETISAPPEVAAIQQAAEAQPLDEVATPIAEEAPANEDLAAEGVLVFLEDPDAASMEQIHTVASTAPVTVEAVATEEATSSQATVTDVTETTHVASAHYHDGKLVAAASQSATLAGEVNTLMVDHTQQTEIVSESQAAAHAGWVDIVALQAEPEPPAEPSAP